MDKVPDKYLHFLKSRMRQLNLIERCFAKAAHRTCW